MKILAKVSGSRWTCVLFELMPPITFSPSLLLVLTLGSVRCAFVLFCRLTVEYCSNELLNYSVRWRNDRSEVTGASLYPAYEGCSQRTVFHVPCVSVNPYFEIYKQISCVYTAGK
jgi:hypothetical protein